MNHLHKRDPTSFSTIHLLIVLCLLLCIISAQPFYSSAKRLIYITICKIYNAPPRWSIVRLFDSYAEEFEAHLIQTLEYRTPKDMADFIRANSSLSTVANALDLGCGTGLLGVELTKQFQIKNLHGVDFSQKMLQKSKQKDIYNALHYAEMHEFLQNCNTKYDLITAADVLNYVGDLKNMFALALQHLEKDAYFAFSVEVLENGTFKLMNNGRFQHNLNYIQELSKSTGFRNLKFKPDSLRKEYGSTVNGYIVLLQK